MKYLEQLVVFTAPFRQNEKFEEFLNQFTQKHFKNVNDFPQPFSNCKHFLQKFSKQQFLLNINHIKWFEIAN